MSGSLCKSNRECYSIYAKQPSSLIILNRSNWNDCSDAALVTVICEVVVICVAEAANDDVVVDCVEILGVVVHDATAVEGSFELDVAEALGCELLQLSLLGHQSDLHSYEAQPSLHLLVIHRQHTLVRVKILDDFCLVAYRLI